VTFAQHLQIVWHAFLSGEPTSACSDSSRSFQRSASFCPEAKFPAFLGEPERNRTTRMIASSSPPARERKIHGPPRVAAPYSTFVPGAESSNTVCTGGVPVNPSSLQRATTCS
jgi:hypothetical protein